MITFGIAAALAVIVAALGGYTIGRKIGFTEGEETVSELRAAYIAATPSIPASKSQERTARMERNISRMRHANTQEALCRLSQRRTAHNCHDRQCPKDFLHRCHNLDCRR